MATAITLASNASATGSWFAWPGGTGEFRVEGSFGGGTVKLECKGPNGTAQDVGPDVTLTASGGGVFFLGAGEIRCNIATATGVYAMALRVPDAGF
ncbi:MAG: hypothetical protein EBS78_11610 [Altererythrobacter sp.]|jgi:hypothetical protein|nr:hypothetical protein [Altererythrobacter sp.]